MNHLQKFSWTELANIFSAFMIAFILMMAILLLMGCSTVNADPLTDLISKGLQTSSDNLHLAVTVGDLKSTDPALACIDSALAQIKSTSTQYKTDDLISLGSVIYIKTNSLQSKIPTVQQNCDALIGKFVTDALRSQSPLKLR